MCCSWHFERIRHIHNDIGPILPIPCTFNSISFESIRFVPNSSSSIKSGTIFYYFTDVRSASWTMVGDCFLLLRLDGVSPSTHTHMHIYNTKVVMSLSAVNNQSFDTRILHNSHSFQARAIAHTNTHLHMHDRSSACKECCVDVCMCISLFLGGWLLGAYFLPIFFVLCFVASSQTSISTFFPQEQQNKIQQKFVHLLFEGFSMAMKWNNNDHVEQKCKTRKT